MILNSRPKDLDMEATLGVPDVRLDHPLVQLLVFING